jgi:hypothetical protein
MLRQTEDCTSEKSEEGIAVGEKIERLRRTIHGFKPKEKSDSSRGSFVSVYVSGPLAFGLLRTDGNVLGEMTSRNGTVSLENVRSRNSAEIRV